MSARPELPLVTIPFSEQPSQWEAQPPAGAQFLMLP
jgi:hypothetical protein